MKRFADRAEAGRFLSRELERYKDREDVMVLALPRGGVPLGFEIATELRAPLDLFLVRKLGFPGHEEFALGAIASGGVRVLNPSAFQVASFSEAEIDVIAAREEEELARRERLYRGERPPPEVAGKVAILVDDGLATGSTMRAAVGALRMLRPQRIVVAVPVASSDACELVSREADEVICGFIPEPFRSVGEWYGDFAQTTDAEVKELLARSAETRPPAKPAIPAVARA
jgi:putative phosphoribosyl transferase